MQTYEEFIAKFNKEQPKTTDDCYTPEKVWDAVLRFVLDRYKIDPQRIVRPFYPGGDFENEDYSGKIVVDNPPFSIMRKIIKFYMDNGIKFFLFCNTLTAPVYDFTIGKISIIYGGEVVYTNGAVVNTSFVTNLEDTGIIHDERLVSDLKKIKKKPKRKATRPENYVLLPDLATLARCGLGMSIPWEDIEKTTKKTPEGKKLFGIAFVLRGRSAEEYIRRRTYYEERKENSI